MQVQLFHAHEDLLDALVVGEVGNDAGRHAICLLDAGAVDRCGNRSADETAVAYWATEAPKRAVAYWTTEAPMKTRRTIAAQVPK